MIATLYLISNSAIILLLVIAAIRCKIESNENKEEVKK